MIPPKTIRHILETTRIEEVVQDFLPLRRSGANFTARCPFHHEKTPSFSVSPARNIFKCFGCGKGGNAAKFLMEHEGYSFPEALRWLAKKYNIEIQEVQPTLEQLATQQEEESLFIVNDYALKFFQENLPGAGMGYLKSRGFTEAPIQKFGLGYAPDNWDALKKAATQAGFKLQYLQKLGLTTPSGKDFFRHRVIFPITNLGGKVIAFAGRTINNETIQQSNHPKYLNSPESPLYQKGQTLYGIHMAKQAIRRQDECILVEGYTDLIAIHQAGIENIVASAGTAITSEQLLLIRRFSTNLKILYDGDPAGIQATLRGLDLALELDMNVKIVPLPHPDDPDSFLRKVGINAFTEFITNHAVDFINFKANTLLSGAGNDPVKKAAAVHNIVDSIAHVPDPLKRSFFVKDCAALVGLGEEVLAQETAKTVRALAERQRLVIPRGSNHSSMLSPQKETYERYLIRLLLEHGAETLGPKEDTTIAEFILGSIEDILEHFEDPLCLCICRESIELVKSKQPVAPHHFTSHEDLAISGLVVEVLFKKIEPGPYWEEIGHFPSTHSNGQDQIVLITKAIAHLKLNMVNRFCEQNLQRLRNIPGGDETQTTRLLTAQERLNEIRRGLAETLGMVIK
ncbi:MAG: DNA primase [Lewinellaceae bacterium]|nr:DNA primase [Saprospiraceae bacterium]MCB9341681.1 DNA primase [Lewinellaceae bacterium]